MAESQLFTAKRRAILGSRKRPIGTASSTPTLLAMKSIQSPLRQVVRYSCPSSSKLPSRMGQITSKRSHFP